MVRTRARSWVTNNMPMPCLFLIRVSNSVIDPWIETSSAEVTSSQTRTRGRQASARAIATR